MRTASPTTLPLVRGRVDTIVDRLQTLHYGSRNHTFALYRQKLDDIRSKLNECHIDVPTPLAHETAQLLQALFRDLPTAHNAVLYGGQSIPPYAQDWAAFYPEIKQYIRFILNRLHEVSNVPDGAYHVPDDHATAPTVAVHRPPPQPHVTRTASQPSAYSQTQPPPFIPPPEYMRAAQVPRAANFPAAPQRVPVVGHRSMPGLGVPATGVHRVPPHYGPQSVVPRSPGSFYPVAPVPPHLAHMYANSPVLGSARY